MAVFKYIRTCSEAPGLRGTIANNVPTLTRLCRKQRRLHVVGFATRTKREGLITIP